MHPNEVDLKSIEPIEVEGRGRHYPIGDQLYPSVTNILSAWPKPFLVPWAAKVERELVVNEAIGLYYDIVSNNERDIMVPQPPTATEFGTTLLDRLGNTKEHKRQLEKAGDIGHELHDLIHAWLVDEPLPDARLRLEAMVAFEAFLDMTMAMRKIAVEKTVYSHTLKVAGTLDLYAETGPDESAICDWKTSKNIYPEHLIQVCVYAHCAIEMGIAPENVDAIIVRLPKSVDQDPTPEIKVIPASERARYVDTFVHVKSIWEFMKHEADKADSR